MRGIAAFLLAAFLLATFLLATFLLATSTLAGESPPPLGLPPLPVAAPSSPALIALGKKLFFDRRLSVNGTMSCGMCHIETQAFTSNQTATSVGMEGRSLRRKAPSLLNVAYETALFRDGRETTLETQAWAPILSPEEMAAPSIGWLLHRISALPDYAGLFEAAFAGSGASMDRVGEAIAAYERTLVQGNSRFDRWRYGGDATALTGEERAGYALFTGKAGCTACHPVGADSALFTDHLYHDTGIAYQAATGRAEGSFTLRLSGDRSIRLTPQDVKAITAPRPHDLGRFEVTRDPADRWAFKTPSLRNVALTGPYMHDGSIPTLAGIVDFYDAGGLDSPNKSALLKPLGLTPAEKAALVAFLKSLGGD